MYFKSLHQTGQGAKLHVFKRLIIEFPFLSVNHDDNKAELRVSQS